MLAKKLVVRIAGKGKEFVVLRETSVNQAHYMGLKKGLRRPEAFKRAGH